MENISGSPFPGTEQEYLLQAALLDDKDAIIAWEKWKAAVDIEGEMDPGSFRTLPLLYKNLLLHGIEDPFMSRLKGVYRLAWYKNQRLIYDSARVLELFQTSGIETLILKGVALSLLVYKDLGSRPMADIDVLVPRAKARNAIDVLMANGWKPEFEHYLDYNLRYGRSMQFSDDKGMEFDLHWHPFFEAHENSLDTDFWDRAIPLIVSEIQSLSLCPADMLLHVVVHGLRWNPEPPIRWIADACTLINNSENLDWDHLLKNIKKYKVPLQFRDAFEYLNNSFHAGVPKDIMHELDNIPVTYAERLVNKYSKLDPEEPPGSLYLKFRKLFAGYLRQTNDEGIYRQSLGFIKYLRFRTKGRSISQLLKYHLRGQYKENKQ